MSASFIDSVSAGKSCAAPFFLASCAAKRQSGHLLRNMCHYLRHVTLEPIIPFRVDSLFKLYEALRCRLAQVISEAGCIVCQCRIVLSEWRHVEMQAELVSKTQNKTGQDADMSATEHENNKQASPPRPPPPPQVPPPLLLIITVL